MAIRKLQVMVPAALLGAALGSGGLMLASRGSGIVAPSNAAPTKAAATRYDRDTDRGISPHRDTLTWRFEIGATGNIARSFCRYCGRSSLEG